MPEEESQDVDIEVRVDGKRLGTAPFVRQILSATVIGMVSALKGGENAREIEIRVRRK